MAEQRPEGVTVSGREVRCRPQLADPARSVGDTRRASRTDIGHHVWPREHAWHQHEPAAGQMVLGAGGAALNGDRVLGPFKLGMQVAE